jgi:hypothetical protein
MMEKMPLFTAQAEEGLEGLDSLKSITIPRGIRMGRDLKELKALHCGLDNRIEVWKIEFATRCWSN